MNTESSRHDTPFRYRKLGRIGFLGLGAILAVWAVWMIVLPGTPLGRTALLGGFVILIVVYLLARLSRLARRKS